MDDDMDDNIKMDLGWTEIMRMWTSEYENVDLTHLAQDRIQWEHDKEPSSSIQGREYVY